jgi:hypothetical protein
MMPAVPFGRGGSGSLLLARGLHRLRMPRAKRSAVERGMEYSVAPAGSWMDLRKMRGGRSSKGTVSGGWIDDVVLVWAVKPLQDVLDPLVERRMGDSQIYQPAD